MLIRLVQYLLCGITVATLAGCGGLDPTVLPDNAQISGTIFYSGAPWPDSVREVRVVLFQSQPTAPDSVLSAILRNTAVYTDTLRRFVEQESYSLTIPSPPRSFGYVVVAGRTGDNLLKDWHMLAVHTSQADPPVPIPVSVRPGDNVQVNFFIDFANLPPQPFN